MARKFPLTNDEFKSIYSKVPRLCVDLIIKSDQGYLLTLRQKNGWEGKWHFPGGTLYYQESIESAIQRVAQEELGTTVVIDGFLDYLNYPSELKERGFGHSISLAFLCHLPEKAQITLDDQSEKYDFFKSVPKNMVVEQIDFLKIIL